MSENTTRNSVSGAQKLAVAVVSGGLDSVVMAHLLRSKGWKLHLLAFNYGQRHVRELEYSRECAARLDARFSVVDLTNLQSLLSGSALTDKSIEVPHGHYAAANMASTIVPNRNAIFLTIAYGAAVAQNAQMVAAGMHAGDHHVYPDCRPAFVETFAAMQRVAVEGCGDENLRLHTPFIDKTKSEIVKIGAELNVPFARTWSCYEGGEIHCGACGTCVERREAFALANVRDDTIYKNSAPLPEMPRASTREP
jgi:7-cyano-7-deazaguanine synthase